MKLNGYDDLEQLTGSEKHTNGTNDVQKKTSEVLVSDNLPKCSICGITFDSLRDFETHSVSLEHCQKVVAQNSTITLLSDTNNTLTSPLKNQSEKMCVDEVDKKEQQEKHSSSCEVNIVLPENKVFKLPGLTYSCCHCNKKFSGPEPFKQHLESKSHKKKVALENNSFAEIKEIDGHMFCDICKKKFSGEKPYGEHLISKKHRMMEHHFKNVEKSTDDNSASEAKKIKLERKSEIDIPYFCKICEILCCGPIPFSAHLAGSAHKKNKARSEVGVNMVPSINKNGSDLACSENVNQSLQYDDSEPEAKKIKLALEKEKQWFCELCRKQCTGPVPYFQHLAGNDHKKNEARSQAGVNIELSVNQLHPPFPPNNSSINHVNIAAKNVSDIACSDNIANVSATEKIKVVREENKIEIVESKPAWFCRDCEVQCTGPIDYSNHLGGKNHRKKSDIYQKGKYCFLLKDSIDFNGARSDDNGSTGESSFCSLKQNICFENIDYEGELKKSVKIFSPSDEINFD